MYMYMYIQRLGQSSLILWFTSLNAWVGLFFLILKVKKKLPNKSSFLFGQLCILQNNLRPWHLISLVLIFMLKSMALQCLPK